MLGDHALLPGPGRRKAEFGRFNYAEKAEYWALVWGTALMGLTGIMIWAKSGSETRWRAGGSIVATAIHFYEAILATLAIVVWHFYQVLPRSDVYPMNWAWWDGKMPVERYREEHGAGHRGAGRGRSENPSTEAINPVREAAILSQDAASRAFCLLV